DKVFVQNVNQHFMEEKYGFIGFYSFLKSQVVNAEKFGLIDLDLSILSLTNILQEKPIRSVVAQDIASYYLDMILFKNLKRFKQQQSGFYFEADAYEFDKEQYPTFSIKIPQDDLHLKLIKMHPDKFTEYTNSLNKIILSKE
ncbi:14144_t:CDS:2, partial [Gigaspora rosea]